MLNCVRKKSKTSERDTIMENKQSRKEYKTRQKTHLVMEKSRKKSKISEERQSIEKYKTVKARETKKM